MKTWKMLKFIFLFLLTILLVSFEAKIVMIVNEEYEKCMKPEQEAGKFDFSKFEIVATSETEVAYNGTAKVLKRIASPWRLKVFSEKYTRGSWQQTGMLRDMEDFCPKFGSPLEVWHPFMRKYMNPRTCPIDAGVGDPFADSNHLIIKF